MNQAMIVAAVSLAATLAEENEALRALDVARAATLLGRKQADAQVFTVAHALGTARGPGTQSAAQVALAQQVAARLAEAAAENKRLLERAIAVQGDVIAMLLRAVPGSMPTARYAANGTRVARSSPLSLSSRI